MGEFHMVYYVKYSVKFYVKKIVPCITKCVKLYVKLHVKKRVKMVAFVTRCSHGFHALFICSSHTDISHACEISMSNVCKTL